MIPVRQSTAFETSIGPVLDADGVAFTGAIVGDFQIKKNGGDWAALNGSATATHTAVGNYDLVLTTSDLDTVGVAAIRINDTVNACATLFLQVIEEPVYDALYAASANAWSGAAGSSKITGVVLVDTLTTYTGNTPQTGDSYAIVNSGTHGNAALKTLIDAVDNFIDTEIADLGNRLPAALVGGRMDASLGAVQSGVDFSATMKASINTEADTALSDIHLDHLLAVADPIGVVADNSFWAKLHSKNVTAAYSSYDKSTDSLEALATSMASGFFDAQATAGTAQADLDILTGADGVILATSQPNYAPATAAALASLVTTVGAAGAGLTALASAASLAAVAADLPARITKNTALSAFPFFMVDATDHVTAETGLTITATRSIDGGAFGACANSATEIGSGWYKIDLANTDLNGNTIVLSFAGTGADTRFVAIVTQNT